MENEQKKSKFSLRKLIYNDKYLIIFSIIAAVIVWIIASMNLSPETTKTITVPVHVDFTDSAASQLGIKCFGDETIDVDVNISCKKYLARDITSDDIRVSLQTNTVTTKGNLEVPIKVDIDDNSEFDVISYYPTTYKAYFDVEDQKTMDINVEYSSDNFVEDGYIMGEALLSETTAEISGPKTYVSQVAKLIANVNVDEKLRETKSVDLNVTPVDSSGSTVDYVKVNIGSDNLTLTIPVLKQMKLEVTSTFTNVPKGVDTSKFDVSYSVNSVNAGVLEEAEISQANIGNIDFSQLGAGKNEIVFNVDDIDSIIILDNISEITASVVVPAEYTTSKASVSKDMVTVTNIPEGYNVSVDSIDVISVQTIGLDSKLSEISKSDIGLVVDLSAYENNLQLGTNTYDLVTSLDNIENCWIYGSYHVTLTVTEK